MPLSDKELFERVALGDELAYTELYNKYVNTLYAYVLKLTKSDYWAEEIVHDVFLNLWNSRNSLANVTYPAGFLFRMTANKSVDWIRKHGNDLKVQYFLANQHEGVASNNAEESVDLKATKKLIEQSVNLLPAQRKKIYVMKQELGLSYDEIARELGLSRHTVRNQWSTALENMRDFLLRHGGILLTLIFTFKNFF